MEDDQWKPVQIKSKSVARSYAGQVSIVWLLEGGVNNDWVFSWTPTGNKSGSGMFVLSGTEPEVSVSGKITWDVPENDLAGAHEYVKSCLEATNATYSRTLESHRQSAIEQQAKTQEYESKIAKLQEELDGLN